MTKIYDDGSSYAWTPEMGEDGIVIRISKSTAGSLGWCAQQMWLQQNYPKPQGLVKHLVVGDDVHNGLDLLYQGMEEMGVTEGFRMLLRKGEDVTSYLKSRIPDEKTIVANRRAENKDFPFYHDEYYNNMNWLMEFENARMKMDAENPLPVANEVRVEVRVEMDIEGYGTVPVQFVGIIDRVFNAPDGGGLMLYELKTGKWNNWKTADMRKEMAFYKFLIEQCDADYRAELGLERPITHWGWRYSAADHWHTEKSKTVSERSMMTRVKKLRTTFLSHRKTPSSPHAPTATTLNSVQNMQYR